MREWLWQVRHRHENPARLTRREYEARAAQARRLLEQAGRHAALAHRELFPARRRGAPPPAPIYLTRDEQAAMMDRRATMEANRGW